MNNALVIIAIALSITALAVQINKDDREYPPEAYIDGTDVLLRNETQK